AGPAHSVEPASFFGERIIGDRRWIERWNCDDTDRHARGYLGYVARMHGVERRDRDRRQDDVPRPCWTKVVKERPSWRLIARLIRARRDPQAIFRALVSRQIRTPRHSPRSRTGHRDPIIEYLPDAHSFLRCFGR